MGMKNTSGIFNVKGLTTVQEELNRRRPFKNTTVTNTEENEEEDVFEFSRL